MVGWLGCFVARLVRVSSLLLLMSLGVAFAQIPVPVGRWTVSGEPKGIAVGPEGNVYVTNDFSQVQVFSSSGVLIDGWGVTGTGEGQLPLGYLPIAVGRSGRVYLGDSIGRMQVFDAFHQLLAQWRVGDSAIDGVAVDEDENVYVLLGGFNPGASVSVFDMHGTAIRRWGSYGTGSDQLIGASALGLDGLGHVFVGGYSCKVQAFTTKGDYLQSIGGLGRGPGQFDQIFGVAADKYGRLYVADRYNARIQVFHRDILQGELRLPIFGGGLNVFPFGVALDHGPSDQLYVTDPYANCVYVFGQLPTPAAKLSWGALKRRYH